MLCPHCIYVFCIYLKTNSDLCHLQHKLIGFYNRDEKCLQRGTDWGFKYRGLRFVFKGIIVAQIKVAAFSIGRTTLLSPDDCLYRRNTNKYVVMRARATIAPFSPYAIKSLCLREWVFAQICWLYFFTERYFSLKNKSSQ